MAIPRTVVIAQGKGGVGKTSITCNVAGLAASAGHRVLIVDFDPQGNVARDVGLTPGDGKALSNAIFGGSPVPVEQSVRDNLDVALGGPAMGDIAGLIQLQQSRGEDGLTANVEASIAAVADTYDLILIDTPPGERMLVEAAMSAATSVVIPTRSDEASLDGLKLVAQRFIAARQTNPDLSLAGVVLFALGARSRRLENGVRAAIDEIIGSAAPLFETRVRYLESAAVDARREGLLVHELEAAANQARKDRIAALRAGERPKQELLVSDPTGLASDYENLAVELITRIAELESLKEIPA